MSSLVNTDLAPVTTNGKDLYLYYQSNDNASHLLEAYSEDGTKWQQTSTPVATNVRSWAAPIAAYYVKRDATLDKKSTIHVLYLNESNELAERVKDLSGTTWKDGRVLDGFSPEQTTKLTAGAFNATEGQGWNPDGSQWAYFTTFEGQIQISEIRRTPSDPWHYEKILPDEFGESLPGTRLSASVYYTGINLFFQDHDLNVAVYAHPRDRWEDKYIVVDSSKVQASTPIASAHNPSDMNAKQHLFVVDTEKKIQHWVDGKNTPIADYYPGTNLGAVAQGNEVVLFYKTVHPAGAVKTKVYDGSSWTDGNEAVPAPQ